MHTATWGERPVPPPPPPRHGPFATKLILWAVLRGVCASYATSGSTLAMKYRFHLPLEKAACLLTGAPKCLLPDWLHYERISVTHSGGIPS